jgi:hypothetical protein
VDQARHEVVVVWWLETSDLAEIFELIHQGITIGRNRHVGQLDLPGWTCPAFMESV